MVTVVFYWGWLAALFQRVTLLAVECSVDERSQASNSIRDH